MNLVHEAELIYKNMTKENKELSLARLEALKMIAELRAVTIFETDAFKMGER